MAQDYIAGSIALVLVVGPWLFGAPRLARRLLPDWQGAPLALAAAVLGVSGVVVVAQVCGAVGGFSRWTVAIASAVTGLVAAAFGRRSDRDRIVVSLPADRAARVALLGVGICVFAVSATMLARDAHALRTGPDDADSLHYHLSIAADFVQTHSVDHLHETAASDATVFYPYDAELLEAVGMLGPHPDIGVFGLNLLFGWLALLACWVIGARWSMAAPATAAGAFVLALPLVAGASTGPGLNDIPTLAVFLSGVGLLITAGVPRGELPIARWLPGIAVAGLALGLAAGSKLSTLAPVVLVALGAVALARGDRWRLAGLITGAAVLTGGLWYIRDWAEAGSPLPSLNLTVGGHGLHQVPYPEASGYSFTVAHYLGNFSVIRHWYAPGLHAAWSVLWPLVLVLLVVGVILAAVRDPDPIRKVLAAVVVIGFVAYMVTPTTALGPRGQPVLFAANTRYALPEVILAMVLFGTSGLFARYAGWLTSALTVLVLVALANRHFDFKLERVRGLAAAIVVLVVAGALLALWQRRGRRAAAAALVGCAVVFLGVGAELQHKYLADRYQATDARTVLYHYVGAMSGQRVVVYGFGLQYPYYGTHFANTVNYLGVTQPDKSFEGPRTCVQARTALNADRATIAVLQHGGPENPGPVLRWIRNVSGVRVLLQNSAGTVVRLPGNLPLNGCPSGSVPPSKLLIN